MGVYSNGDIYGICIYNFIDDYMNILYEISYNVIMNKDQMNEVFLFYLGLENKDNIKFNVYFECSSSLELNNHKKFMMWHPLSQDSFLETFGNSFN